MKNITIIATLFFLTSISFAKTEAPSSKIPAKRSFPLSKEVSPCEDFNKYVCSIAQSKFKLRDDRSYHAFAFNDSRERILESKKKFMKNLPKEKKLSLRGQQVKNFYSSCMNVKARAEEEKNILLEIKTELAQIKDAKAFSQYLISQTKKGKPGLLSFWPSANMDDPMKQNFNVFLNIMDLPDHSYYEKPEVMAAYQNVLAEFFHTANPDLTIEQANKKAEAQVKLQKEFIKIYPVASVRRQRWSEKRADTQEKTIKKYSNLDIKEIFKDISTETLVNISIPESVDFLNSKMKDSQLDLLKDLYLYKVATDFMDEGYPKFFQTQFDFRKNHFGGPQVRTDLQERCTTAANKMFEMEIDQILIDRLFPSFKDTKVLEVASKIRNSIVAGLEKNTWLTADTKKEAIRKISSARLQLVRPRTDKEWDFLPIQTYLANAYLENKRIYNLANYNKNLEDLKHPTNLDVWEMGPLTVNAYYSPSKNKFVMPLGILQYPFFDKDGSIIENLGAVGAVVGHELGHSIDDQGSKYDADGKLQDWMSMKDKAEFSKRGKKMIEQFNKAEHDGTLTQGENIADLVGLTFAYQAAFPEGKGSVEDKKKFFVSYARVWCSVARPDFEKMLLKTDPHASGKARINEQVKHQPAFAEAYQCKAGDKMFLSEEERVQIW